MTEETATYQQTYTKADVDALRKYDQEAIERLKKEQIAGVKTRASIARTMESLLEKVAEQRGDIDALTDEQSRMREEIRGYEMCLDYEREVLRQLRDVNRGTERRLAEQTRRREMAQKCLAADKPEVDFALRCLEARDIPEECEDCGGPCDTTGDHCLLCGKKQHYMSDLDRCPQRPGEFAARIGGAQG